MKHTGNIISRGLYVDPPYTWIIQTDILLRPQVLLQLT